MPTCKNCGADIIWREHIGTGRSAPINAKPDPAGNLVLVGMDRYRAATVAEIDSDVILHTSHFATCPFAKKFRVNR